MKHVFFTLLSGLALVSCSEISTDPAPVRVTRTAQTVTINYARTASTIASDTLLVDPRLDIYVLTPTVNTDGTLSYPTLTGATPVKTIRGTEFTSAAQSYTVATNLTVSENTPSTGIRLVLSSTNRPGRRANSQRLTANLLVNGVSKTPTPLTLQGSSFTRTAAPVAGRYSVTLDTNVAAYTF
ncbi:hypothetical protein [Hymenobacter sp.]|jgi:hypothetical protein|uniref:hypothetical protein n=1 Tax=Hymenobacter sp. TaxID=1898978 RepID=UPI002ED84671